jgi:hypothetical protein
MAGLTQASTATPGRVGGHHEVKRCNDPRLWRRTAHLRPRPHAQIDLGTWVRGDQDSTAAMTLLNQEVRQ